MTDEYMPPTLTNDEQAQAVQVGNKINVLHDLQKRRFYLIALVAENMRLVKQVNDLRAQLGLAPIATHQPDPTRI